MNEPLQIKKFNDRVRAMNSANAKTLVLNVDEARALHAEIYDLMAIIAELNKRQEPNYNATMNISMDGGRF
jgi:hypothetical protein